MKKSIYLIALLIVSTFTISSCSSWLGKVNIFPVEQDVALGKQVSQSFEQGSAAVVLDSAQAPTLYKYIYGVRDSILNTNLLVHKNDFPWRIRIIHNDTIQNAFCTPGGYIYVYTGLMRYLESEDQLAGVMGHEMAHAEKRHSTDAMTREFGANLLLELIFGTNKAQLLQIATGLAQLSFGRDAETEADNCSVDWLYQTSYNAAGAAGFFEKMQKEKNKVNIPEFLSTHPDPGNRVANMKKRWSEKGGKMGQTYTDRYKKMLTFLPKS
jgi:predicted Zn-dependent protease